MASGAERGQEQSASPEAANTNQLSGLSEETADDQCSICLGEISSPAYASDCFHTFCFGCIWQWACTNPVCPLCRKPFDGILRILKMDATQENVVGFHISQQMPENREEVGSRSLQQQQQQQQLSLRSSTDDPTEESMESGMGDGEAQPEAAPEASSQQGAGENPAGSGEGNVVHYSLQEGLNFMETE